LAVNGKISVKSTYWSRRFVVAAVFGALVVLEFACVKQHTNAPLANQPPQTFFWLYPDTGIATGVSRQQLRWWGEDADGYVVGYLLAIEPDMVTIPAPDTLTYAYVTVSDSLISFPLRQKTQTFLVAVHSIDNTFRFALPVGAAVKLSPFPYWDKNGNGTYDPITDVNLDGLTGAMDPNGARQRFPTINTPPVIDYVYDMSDPSLVAQPPTMTFTVASFSWAGRDLDGDETIKLYRISLNDSTFSNPVTVSSSVTTVTLAVPRSRSDAASALVDADVLVGSSPNLRTVGTIPGLKLDAPNALYVESIDVAGDSSRQFLRFPTSGRTWFVKKPRGRMLVVSDYTKADTSVVRIFYRDSVFTRVGAGQFGNYDVLDLGLGKSQTSLGVVKPGILVPSFQHINPALTKTLKLFDCVFWYTDATPTLIVAQYTLFDYWTSSDGGHLVYSTEFQTLNDPSGALQDFTPVDSVSSVSLLPPLTYPLPGDNQIPGGYLLYPDSSEAGDIYPLLEFGTRFSYSFNMRPIYKNAGARYIYHLQPDGRGHYIGMPNLGVIDESKRMVFMALSLNYLTGSSKGKGVAAFFNKVFQEFGLQ
jgi:hypothetical protein